MRPHRRTSLVTFELLGTPRPITFALDCLESFRAVELSGRRGEITEGTRVRMRSGDEFMVAASHREMSDSITAVMQSCESAG